MSGRKQINAHRDELRRNFKIHYGQNPNGSDHYVRFLERKLFEMGEALKDAVNGIEWWTNHHPIEASEADYERIEHWKKLTNQE